MMDMQKYVAWRLYAAKNQEVRNLRVVEFIPMGVRVQYNDRPAVVSTATVAV